MRCLPRILSLIRDKLNKFNNTGAQLLVFFFSKVKKRVKIRNQYNQYNLTLEFYSNGICAETCQSYYSRIPQDTLNTQIYLHLIKFTMFINQIKVYFH